MDTVKAQKGYKGLPMEGVIASWYTRTTAGDMKRHKQMAAKLAPEIRPGSDVLEIAPGPGFFCIELAKIGDYRITGLDISKSFVEIARKNASKAGLAIDFRLGNASDVPFGDESFDFIFCQAAFKNFSEPVKAIAEMYRVLRPNGAAVISDLRCDASAQEIDQAVRGMELGRLNAAITRWTFDSLLLKNAYNVKEMEAMIAQTPFGEGRVEADGISLQARLEK